MNMETEVKNRILKELKKYHFSPTIHGLNPSIEMTCEKAIELTEKELSKSEEVGTQNGK